MKAEISAVCILFDAESITIQKAGWPNEYHVIRELGELGESIYSKMTSEQIRNRFNIDIEKDLQ